MALRHFDGTDASPEARVGLDELARATGDVRLARAARAEELLKDSLFIEAVEGVRLLMTQRMVKSKRGAAGLADREEGHAQLHALDAVIHLLHRVLVEGQLIQAGKTGGSAA